MFVAEEGSALVVGEWSQMELRILAQYSKDPLLLSAYTGETGIDLHRLTASKMFGKFEAEVTDSERTVAKMINFGIAYGITPVGLFTRLRPQGVDVTLEQCERFIADYFNAYSGVQKFINDVEMRLKERGYVKNWFGRRRRLSGQTKREIRQASNFLIQGTGADIAKAAMVRLHAALPEGARLISIVHDEFIVECRQEQAEEVRLQMVETMQTAPEGFVVPMVVEAKVAVNWGDPKWRR
jgi:DNA polymerase-1